MQLLYMYVLVILLNGGIICTLKIIMITLIKKKMYYKNIHLVNKDDNELDLI